MPPLPPPGSLLGHLLLAWVVVLAVARGLGLVFQRLRQPAVMGEIVGGILLGPSFLGVLFPSVQDFLFPPALVPWLAGLAQLAVVIYMFFVGLELDWPALRHSACRTVVIAFASILIPFLLGVGWAGTIDAAWAGPLVDRSNFMLFVGVAMSVTAFPVLARILTETGLIKTPLGNLSLACAALNDVVAWCLLAVVVSLAQAQPADGEWILVRVVVYVTAMVMLVRPVLGKVLVCGSAVWLVLLAASAYVADRIGIHAIFGAFLLGAIVPRKGLASAPLAYGVERWMRILLLPLFFAATGLRTQINLLNSPADWGLCLVVIALATAGKWGGTTVAARATGYCWQEALTLGVLMNTRGLVELIVLNAGLELNLISPKMFTLLVLMAVVTTLMTCPILQLISRLKRAPAGP